ncbi:RNA polymerase subunit sigma-24 [Rhodococcus ruber]|nr:RNA polymerase subunit sigma-24 [Rhodococcus ruber]
MTTDEAVTTDKAATRPSTLIAALPHRYRAVLHLRIACGLSITDTARALNTDAASVRLAQHHALNLLRHQLGHFRNMSDPRRTLITEPGTTSPGRTEEERVSWTRGVGPSSAGPHDG